MMFADQTCDFVTKSHFPDNDFSQINSIFIKVSF